MFIISLLSYVLPHLKDGVCNHIPSFPGRSAILGLGCASSLLKIWRRLNRFFWGLPEVNRLGDRLLRLEWIKLVRTYILLLSHCVFHRAEQTFEAVSAQLGYLAIRSGNN